MFETCNASGSWDNPMGVRGVYQQRLQRMHPAGQEVLDAHTSQVCNDNGHWGARR
jgi:hypothetical protein